jgi:HSP20 family protein
LEFEEEHMVIVRREAAPVARRAREWDPFRNMRDLMRDPFEDLLTRVWQGGGTGAGHELIFVPDFEVRETKDAYVFHADVPGFKESDLEVNVTGNRLMISGRREAEDAEEGDTYYLAERTYGAFTRTFTLPQGIKADQVRADLKDGVLTVQVPKSSETQPQRITVGGGAGQGNAEQMSREMGDRMSQASGQHGSEQQQGGGQQSSSGQRK